MARCTFCLEAINSLEDMERLTYQTLDTLMETHKELMGVEGKKGSDQELVSSAWTDIDVTISDLMKLCKEMGWYSMPNDRREAGSE